MKPIEFLQAVLLAAVFVHKLVALPISGSDVEPPKNNATQEEKVGRSARWIFKTFSESKTKLPETTVPSLVSASLPSPTMEAPAGFQVFGPKLRHRGRHTKKPTTGTTKKNIMLYAEPQDSPEGEAGSPSSGSNSDSSPEAGGGGEAGGGAGGEPGGGAGGGAGGGESPSDGGSGGSQPGKELTLKVPQFDTDAYGGRVFNPWAVTFGNINLDTRFNEAQFDIPRFSMEMNPVTNYYPKGDNLTTACFNRSTIYNEIKVEKWLVRHIYSKRKKERAFFMAFRREIYDMANSEECHTPDLDDWLTYQQCALRRNQRMEYYIPEYPRQQLALN